MREVLNSSPADWQMKEVGKFATFLRRGKSPIYSDTDQGLLIVNQDCIRWNCIDLSKAKYHTTPTNIPADFYLREGDILVNSTGAGTIGRINQWQRSDVIAVVDSHVTLLRVDQEQVSTDYIRYFLSSESAQRFLEAVCFSGSTNQIELSRRYFSKMKIPCPALDEQKVIAEILRRLDKTIEYTEASMRAAERLKRSLMQNLLTGKLKAEAVV